jgi:hypothetical protein
VEGSTEIPVLIEELGCETHVHWCCRTLVEVTVAGVNLTIAIAVNIHTLDRFAVLVVNLLVNEE